MAAAWECPALPMIALPLKESSKSSFQAIKPLIASNYGENPESFVEEIKQLEQLRENSLRPQRDYQGCNLARRYYAQLHLLLARFPEESGKIPVHFAWKDAFVGSETKQEGLQLELASLLYNIGALHSQVGGKDGRHNEQDMKESLTHFQCAAGAFQYFYDNHTSHGSNDLSPQLVEMYKNLMLAQAQECTVDKSLKGLSRVKNLNISKISMKVSQYYQSVLTVLESPVGATLVKKHKDWLKLLQIKVIVYAAIAHLYQSNALEEQGNYGYMIAFQQLALQKVQSVGKLSRSTPDVLKEAVKNLAEYLSMKVSTSLSQNEQVFHELVPDVETLEPAPGVELVKPVVFQPVDRKTAGSDIFSRLVPMSAYEASSVYSEEKAKILRSVTSSVEEKEEELERFLSSLNMEEIDHAKAENPTIPAELLNQQQQLQSKQKSIQVVQVKIEELKTLSQRVQHQLDTISQRKREEEEEERRFQEHYGKRAESQVCTSIWRELTSLSQYHKQASNSNEELFNAFDKHKANLLLLSGPKHLLVSAVPRLTPEDANKDFNEGRWRELMDKVNEMKSQRVTLISQLRDQIAGDDITRVIIGELSTNRDAVFDEHLQQHRGVADIIRQNLTAQDNILRALTEANAGQAQLRQEYHQMMKRREEWCVGLVKSAGCYGFLESKIVEGLGFYSKLAESVLRLLKRCQEVCGTRRRERQALERREATPTATRTPDIRSPSPKPPPGGNSHEDHTPMTHPHNEELDPPTQDNDNGPHPQVGVSNVEDEIMRMKRTQEEQGVSLSTTPTAPGVGGDNVPHLPVDPKPVNQDIDGPVAILDGQSLISDNEESATPTLMDGSLPLTHSPEPDDPVSITDNEVPIPVSQVPIPFNQVPIPGNQVPIPVNQVPIPFNQVPIPVNQVPIPFNQVPIPVSQVPDDPIPSQIDPPNVTASHTPTMFDHTPSLPPSRPDKPPHLMGVAVTPSTDPVTTPIIDNSNSFTTIPTPSIPMDGSYDNTKRAESPGTVRDPIDANLHVTTSQVATPTTSIATPTTSIVTPIVPQPLGTMGVGSLGVDSHIPPASLPPPARFVSPPPLSVTTLVKDRVGVATGGVAPLNTSSVHLEQMISTQQKMISNQSNQLDQQQEQLKAQTQTIDELRKELQLLRVRQSDQEREKTASSSNQAMLVKLLQQQQGLFTQQQTHMDKISKEGEARRAQTSELEMGLRDALAQEQFQNQALQGQLAQQTKDIQHLQQQLQSSSQQLQGLQTQAQQYLVQIQERDKALGNYREEHRRIVDGMESQFKQRVQQLTQQVQELQARGNMMAPPTRGVPPPGLQPPLQPRQQYNQQQPYPPSSSPYQSVGRGGGLMDSPNPVGVAQAELRPSQVPQSTAPNQLGYKQTPPTEHTPVSGQVPPTRQAPPTGHAPIQTPPTGYTPGQAPPTGYTTVSGQAPPIGYTPVSRPTGYTPGQAPPTGYTPVSGQAPPTGYTPVSGQAPPTGYTPVSGQAPPTGYTPVSGRAPPTGHPPAQTPPTGYTPVPGQVPITRQTPPSGQTTPTGHAFQHQYSGRDKPVGPATPTTPVPRPPSGGPGGYQQQPTLWSNDQIRPQMYNPAQVPRYATPTPPSTGHPGGSGQPCPPPMQSGSDQPVPRPPGVQPLPHPQYPAAQYSNLPPQHRKQ